MTAQRQDTLQSRQSAVAERPTVPRLVTEYLPALAALLPHTQSLLNQSRLVLHDAVMQVTLLGSRGLADAARGDSDIDLSLMVSTARLPTHEPARADLLRAVLETTLGAWQSPVELDAAAVFDTGNCCGMRCFSLRTWDESVIQGRGVDCFGIYKVQRGFNGYVTEGVRLDQMIPMLPIWRAEN